MFYATPHEGAQVVAIGTHLLNNPALRQMVPVHATDYLQQLNEDWPQPAFSFRGHVQIMNSQIGTAATATQRR